VFNANLNICAPYLSDSEEERFRAHFASIKVKADYLIIDEEFHKVAAENGCSLVDIKTW